MEKTKEHTISLNNQRNNSKPIHLSSGSFRFASMNGQEKTISEPVLSNDFYTEKRLGWLPDVPDFRDYTMDNNKLSEKDLMRGKTLTVKQMLTNTGMKKSALKIPNKKDLRSWFSPIEDQGNLGAEGMMLCAAIAGFAR